MFCSVRRAGFTLIELLVVVAIVALLISLLLPSLTRAREQTRAVVCGSNLKVLTTTVQQWMVDGKMDRPPAPQGWASGVLQHSQGQAGIFTCTSDRNPFPLPALLVRLLDTDRREADRVLSLDGGLAERRELPDNRGYLAGLEGARDFDYDDIRFTYKPDSPGQTWIDVTVTETDVHSWTVCTFRGKTMIPVSDVGSGSVFPTTLMWGSYGMNLSAGLAGATQRMILLLDYYDWIADSEYLTVQAKSSGGKTRAVYRQDPQLVFEQKSDTHVADRHNRKANVSFMDGSVIRMAKAQLHFGRPIVTRTTRDENAASIWHPRRPVNPADNGWKGLMQPRQPWF